MKLTRKQRNRIYLNLAKKAIRYANTFGFDTMFICTELIQYGKLSVFPEIELFRPESTEIGSAGGWWYSYGQDKGNNVRATALLLMHEMTK